MRIAESINISACSAPSGRRQEGPRQKEEHRAGRRLCPRGVGDSALIKVGFHRLRAPSERNKKSLNLIRQPDGGSETPSQGGSVSVPNLRHGRQAPGACVPSRGDSILCRAGSVLPRGDYVDEPFKKDTFILSRACT